MHSIFSDRPRDPMAAHPARAPRTEVDLLWFAVGVALPGGICNLLPFFVCRSWARSRRAMSSTGELDLADPRVVGIIAGGVCLAGTAATLHTVVVLDVFLSQPATASRYAIANIAIVVFEVAVPLLGYLVGWAAGSLIVVMRRWHRRRKWLKGAS
jgi:hypothetical protein